MWQGPRHLERRPLFTAGQRQRLPQRLLHPIDEGFAAEPHLVFLWMDVDVELLGRQLQEKEKRRIFVVVPLLAHRLVEAGEQNTVAHQPTVHE